MRVALAVALPALGLGAFAGRAYATNCTASVTMLCKEQLTTDPVTYRINFELDGGGSGSIDLPSDFYMTDAGNGGKKGGLAHVKFKYPSGSSQSHIKGSTTGTKGGGKITATTHVKLEVQNDPACGPNTPTDGTPNHDFAGKDLSNLAVSDIPDC